LSEGYKRVLKGTRFFVHAQIEPLLPFRCSGTRLLPFAAVFLYMCIQPLASLQEGIARVFRPLIAVLKLFGLRALQVPQLSGRKRRSVAQFVSAAADYFVAGMEIAHHFDQVAIG